MPAVTVIATLQEAQSVIFIVVKFPIRAEYADEWPTLSAQFTAATRAEPGNLFFEWSRSLDDPSEYVLVEGFRDGPAGAAHVQSPHFQSATATFARYVRARPKIINVQRDDLDWSEMGEIEPD